MDAPDTQHLGQQIRDLRKAKGMALARLAARVNRSAAYLSLVERNLAQAKPS